MTTDDDEVYEGPEEELTAEKIESVLRAIPDEVRPPARYKLTRDMQAEIEVNNIGLGHTYIGGVDISSITNAISIDAVVGEPTRITIGVIAVPAKLRVLGIIELVESDQAASPGVREHAEDAFLPHVDMGEPIKPGWPAVPTVTALPTWSAEGRGEPKDG